MSPRCSSGSSTAWLWPAQVPRGHFSTCSGQGGRVFSTLSLEAEHRGAPRCPLTWDQKSTCLPSSPSALTGRACSVARAWSLVPPASVPARRAMGARRQAGLALESVGEGGHPGPRPRGCRCPPTSTVSRTRARDGRALRSMAAESAGPGGRRRPDMADAEGLSIGHELSLDRGPKALLGGTLPTGTFMLPWRTRSPKPQGKIRVLTLTTRSPMGPNWQPRP